MPFHPGTREAILSMHPIYCIYALPSGLVESVARAHTWVGHQLPDYQEVLAPKNQMWKAVRTAYSSCRQANQNIFSHILILQELIHDHPFLGFSFSEPLGSFL